MLARRPRMVMTRRMGQSQAPASFKARGYCTLYPHHSRSHPGTTLASLELPLVALSLPPGVGRSESHSPQWEQPEGRFPGSRWTH